ncbi:MAG TPA: GDP-mannose 4,6-dehydratase, partial [Puia sp.]|nr:GDP-mannose 4,6-dehydratase [Puia sp.]
LTHDLTAPFSAQAKYSIGDIDFLVAMASESHVDRSITDPVPFVQNNVSVMLNTLELARELKPRMFLHVSTDEVYGPVSPGSDPFREWDAVLPSNPYSASKAAQEAIAFSYWRTYGVPVVITNLTNIFGERQDKEKFLPLVISKVLSGETLGIHGTQEEMGSRYYLHARNAASAWLFLLTRTEPSMFPGAKRPDRYNIAPPEAVSNLDFAQEIAGYVGKPLNYEFTGFSVRTRPGHDPHYGLDPGKLSALGWKPPVDFRESLERTVRWTLSHPEWLE